MDLEQGDVRPNVTEGQTYAYVRRVLVDVIGHRHTVNAVLNDHLTPILSYVDALVEDEKPVRRHSLGGAMSTGAEMKCKYCGFMSDGYQGKRRTEHLHSCPWITIRTMMGLHAPMRSDTPDPETAERLAKIAALEEELKTLRQEGERKR